MAQFALQLRAQSAFIASIGIVTIKVDVVDESIVLIRTSADPKANVVADWTGEHTTGTTRTVVTRIDLQRTGQILGRIWRHHIDQTRHGVGAVKRALRATQHLNLLHIKQRGCPAQTTEIDPIHDKAYGWIQRLDELAALANTANLKKTCTRSTTGQIHVGCAGQQLIKVVDQVAAGCWIQH